MKPFGRQYDRQQFARVTIVFDDEHISDKLDHLPPIAFKSHAASAVVGEAALRHHRRDRHAGTMMDVSRDRADRANLSTL